MHHELKLLEQYFDAVLNREKTFEVRVNDRGFQKGDTVQMFKYSIELSRYVSGNMGSYENKYADKTPIYRIGYVLQIDNERVVFSLCEDEALNKEKV